MRAVGPMRNPGMGAIYLHPNRNKRSAVLDLKTAAGRQACLALATTDDVPLYNTSQHALASRGLAYHPRANVNHQNVSLGAHGLLTCAAVQSSPVYGHCPQWL